MTSVGAPATVLVTSSQNTASSTIARVLRESHAFESTRIELFGSQVYQSGTMLLVTIDTEIVSPPDLDAYFNPQAYIFLSSHYAESGIPSLTAHTTGNFTREEYLGGRPREVGRVNPDLLKNYLIALNSRKHRLAGYEITIEATHHGPTSLQKPVLFVELGSSERNWSDRDAASVIADAVVEAATNGRSWDRVGMAFGGPHYSDKFNKLLVETDTALTTIVAKRYLGFIDSEMFAQMVQKTTKFARSVIIDWKGMGQHKEAILALAKQFALEVVRV